MTNGQSRSPPKENGIDLGLNRKKDVMSPQSGRSSASSTPAPKKSSEDGKPPTPKSTPPADPGLKTGLPGPPYGLGFPPPPGNGHPPSSEAYRSPFDPHPALRAPPVGLPPGGKPYVRFLFHQDRLCGA